VNSIKVILASQAHTINQYKNLKQKVLYVMQIFISINNALKEKLFQIMVLRLKCYTMSCIGL